MNIIRMTGGLGNQMFQYALYLKLISLEKECKFEDWTEYEGKENARPILLKEAFGIEYPRVSHKEYIEFTDSYMDLPHRIMRKIRGRQSRQYEEATADFDEEILRIDNAYLTGYFQSERYFGDIKDIILKSFTFTENVKSASKAALKLSLGTDEISDNNWVSVHFRRGDYLDAIDIYGNICTDEYYKNAISYINSHVDNPHFVFFTNDIEYVNNWIAVNYPNELNKSMFVIQGATEDTGYIDMYLMSCCHHNIIANSSFSWWGAYLNNHNDKLIIAPTKWNNLNSQNDIYTSDMIQL